MRLLRMRRGLRKLILQLSLDNSRVARNVTLNRFCHSERSEESISAAVSQFKNQIIAILYLWYGFDFFAIERE